MASSGEETRSVVVIGAGIIGCSAAYYLSENGQDIEVLDSGGVGEQASTQTAGNLHFQLSYHAMKGTEEEFAHHTLVSQINDDAERRWNELAAVLDPSIEVTQRGGIVVAESEEDLAALHRKVELERDAGFATVYLDGAELRERVPELGPRILGGSWHPREGYVNARMVCYELARVAQQRGVKFSLDTHVRELAPAGGRWRVSTSTGRQITAENVVIAAGSWTQELVAQVGGQVLVDVYSLNMGITEPIQPCMTNLVMHASRPLSIKQMLFGNIMIGGGRPAAITRRNSPLRIAPGPITESIAAGLDDVARVIPSVCDARLIRSWQGLLATPRDELPIIGHISGAPGVHVAVAGHTGFTLGPSCGHAVAQLIAGHDPEFPLAPFDPARFSRSKTR